ncbi:peptidase, putative [Bodo saltans]|uniref:Peptidase, putative n=1 Tax=Bodo saltans TaxID=75058 RepID=A0A0S4J6P0_BODSA|nr:peptidase, putative [Bodo saltans]|eukprot:CUG69448.1 peptidase, putative [Bodo saltans]
MKLRVAWLSACAAVLLLCVNGCDSLRKSASPFLTTNSSTFVSIKVTAECHLSLDEVRPTKSRHFVGFAPSQHPQPFMLQDHYIPHPAETFGMVASTRYFYTHRFRVSYMDNIKTIEMSYVTPDPRVLHTHGSSSSHQEGNDNTLSVDDDDIHRRAASTRGHLSTDEVGYLFLYIPSNIPVLTVQCHNVSMRQDIHLPIDEDRQQHRPMRKHFDSLEYSANGAQLLEIQVSGPPDRVNSVVFLSDGYLASDNETFFNRVKEIFHAIDSSPSDDPALTTMKATVPFARYVAFWNVFAVFQPSPEAGASNRVHNTVVNDNLVCFYPSDIERALQCDNSRALSLARVAPLPENPDNFLIIIIVNSNQYGGTGLFYPGTIHINAFFAGWMGGYHMPMNEYAALVNHECGHAFGNLADEYDYGDHIGSSPYRSLLNCVEPSDNGSSWKTPLPWQFWIDVFHGANTTRKLHYMGKGTAQTLLAAQNYGTDVVPTIGCSFSNYYRGSSRCLMNRLDDFFMCPQCREGASRTLFQTNFELQWPRRPLEDQLVVLSRWNATYQGIAGGGVTLHLPRSLASPLLDNNFAVEWYDAHGNLLLTSAANNPADLDCPTCHFIPAATLETWPLDEIIVFSAIIRDHSIFLRPEYVDDPFLTQIAIFRMIIPSMDPVTNNRTTSAAAAGRDRHHQRIEDVVSTVDTLPSPETIGLYKAGTDAGEVDRKPYLYRCVPAHPAEDSFCNISDLTAATIEVGAGLSWLEAQALALAGLCLVSLWLERYEAAAYPPPTPQMPPSGVNHEAVSSPGQDVCAVGIFTGNEWA